MKAMILAAGLGTRLYPLTRNMPKALVPLNGTPLLEILILRLKQFGFHEIIINIHHLGQQIIDFLKSRDDFGIRISISDERDRLLDTGGAVKKAMPFLGDNEPFLVHNVDVITSLDLHALMTHHLQSGALVTLCVQERSSSRYFYFTADDLLCGWKSVGSGEEKGMTSGSVTLRQRAFSGIHVIGPGFFDKAFSPGCFPPEQDRFSIIDVYLCLAASEKVQGFDHSGTAWFDIGRFQQLKAAEAWINMERPTDS
jgi:NDP-sugar pyrophosphorylase family protein